MRAKLGAASRAAMQFGPTITRREAGTSPLTAFASGVGRFWGLMGLTAATGTDARPSSVTSAAMNTTNFRTLLIQAANPLPSPHRAITRSRRRRGTHVRSAVFEEKGN